MWVDPFMDSSGVGIIRGSVYPSCTTIVSHLVSINDITALSKQVADVDIASTPMMTVKQYLPPKLNVSIYDICDSGYLYR